MTMISYPITERYVILNIDYAILYHLSYQRVLFHYKF